MAENELKVKVTGDSKEARDAVQKVGDEAATLDRRLEKLSEISAAAFRVLSGAITESLKAFSVAEVSSGKLSQALQIQGIYTEELANAYKGYADNIERATGVDGDALVAAQATAQSFLGQTQITERLTAAIADLSAAKGINLNSAAELVAKSIGTSTNALAREGLQLSQNLSQTEKYSRVLEFLEGRYNGQAEAANRGLFGAKALEAAFGNLQKMVGERLAPAVTAVNEFLAKLFNTIAKNKIVGDLVTALLAAGTALAAIGVAVPAVVLGFGAMTTAAAALGVSVNVAFAGIPLAIAAVVAGITFLVTNWEEVTGRIARINAALAVGFYKVFEGIGRALIGAFTLDPSKIQSGLEQIKNSISAGIEFALAPLPEKTKEATDKQNEVLKAAADERAQQARDEAAIVAEIADSELALKLARLEDASQEELAVRAAKIQLLKDVQKAADDEEKLALESKLTELRELEQAYINDKAALTEEQRNIELAARFENRDLELQEDNAFYEAKKGAILANALSDKQIEAKISADKLKDFVDRNNRFLEEQKRYGEAYASINAIINSTEITNAKNAAGQLVSLQKSESTVRKAIGKGAAITQIGIKTAEGAISAYSSLSGIPVVGPALGAAAAAAVVAYGVEQAANVLSAQQGGLVEGTSLGRDSVPAILEPGELVIPKQNFEEVVTATADKRNSESVGGFSGAEIVLTLSDGLADFIEAKLIERENLGLSLRVAT